MSFKLAPAVAFVAAVAMLPLIFGAAAARQRHDRDVLRGALEHEAVVQAEALEDYFSRARTITLLSAHDPAFREFYARPGAREAKLRKRIAPLRKAEQALAYLEHLFPGSIGEACFIDAGGAENARTVRGKVAPSADLSHAEAEAPFFAPTFALPKGRVYHARPYVSPDTGDWVVANATVVPTPGAAKRAIVHYEITIESFRQAAARAAGAAEVAIVDARTGRVVIDSRFAQRAGAGVSLGRPADRRFAGVSFLSQGTLDVQGRRAAYRRVPAAGANEWVVVALARSPRAGWIESLGLPGWVLIGLAMTCLALAGGSLAGGQRRLRRAALTDAVTGLGNRHRLLADLDWQLSRLTRGDSMRLMLFDLDGFKAYNDTFGHPAGDALLVRLGGRLQRAVGRGAASYRMGGDEFCVLIPPGAPDPDALAAAAVDALYDHGEGFEVGCSFGSVELTAEAGDAAAALAVADRRLYASKRSGRTSAGQQSIDVLLRVLSERSPDLGDHVDGVLELVRGVGEALGLSAEDLVPVLQAAALHDVGKAAIPDAILTKPGPLDKREWAFMWTHTLIGERILLAAPALAGAAALVRASHERIDGGGYPDGLAGEEIPLGARIIAVCDAYEAMTADRPYRAALTPEEATAELRRCAGTQFDERVVGVLCEILSSAPAPAAHRA